MQNSREIRGSKWSEAVYFERILVGIVRVWAHLSSFSSNPCSKAVQNDHIPHGSDIKHAHPFNANRYKDCSTFAVHGHRNRTMTKSLPIAAEPETKGRYAFVSLGCPKNIVDSERMLGKLAQDGYALQPDADGADVVVVNTCGFIEPARQESLGVIREMLDLQEARAGSGRSSSPAAWPSGSRTMLLEQVPEVDQIVGVFGREEIAPGRRPGRRRSLRRAAVALPPRPGAGARRHGPAADHPAALRLPEDLRGLRPALHLLRDPRRCAASTSPSRSRRSSARPASWPPTASAS